MNDFRNSYLTYDALMAQLRTWADAHPTFVRLTSLGTTAEGRDIPLLTVGPEPDRRRPSVWVDANMHASEVAGTSVVLAIAEDLIALHDGRKGAALAALGTARDSLAGVLFFLCPRMSPDGAERVLTDARWVRSLPGLQSGRDLHPRWVHADIDGDGRALLMRREDPAGDWVPLEGVPEVMRPRRLEDPGPWYCLYPEGHVAHFDGHHIPDPHYLSDSDVDLNRNFPGGWRPEHEQAGAGAFPMSAPESRAVVDFAVGHPEIFAWLNLHCFGGVFIRPLGDQPDTKMDADELSIWRQLEVWAKAHTGYPVVSGFEEFTYEPDKPLHGDLTTWAHQQRGAMAWVVELWDIFARLGMPRPKRFVDYYDLLGPDELARLAAFDRDHNDGRMFAPWRAVDHPQLGRVEVGGFAPLIGLWNPPEKFLPEICRGQADVLLRVASMAPKVALSVRSERLAAGAHLVHVDIVNTGYLATHGLPSAKALPVSEPLWLSLESEEGISVDTPHRVEIGHLEGWGRGHLNGGQSILMPRSRGNRNQATRSFVVRGAGRLVVAVESSRVGRTSTEVNLAP
jgi:hypothetical protein